MASQLAPSELPSPLSGEGAGVGEENCKQKSNCWYHGAVLAMAAFSTVP